MTNDDRDTPAAAPREACEHIMASGESWLGSVRADGSVECLSCDLRFVPENTTRLRLSPKAAELEGYRDALRLAREALVTAEKMNRSVHDRPDARGYSLPDFRAAIAAIDALIPAGA